MNDNDIEITLDNDNENIDVDREESIYTNISEEEINEIRAGIQTNKDDITDIRTEQITQNENIETNISNIERNTSRIRILESDSGNKVSLNINSNYVMTLQLLNKDNEVLSTGTIDLPIESMVVNASYRNGILTLTLQNGQTLNVDISDIVSGLVSETTFNDAVSRLDGLINGLSRRMTSAEGEIDDIQNDISDIKAEQTQQNTNIETNRTNIATNTQEITNIKTEQVTQNNEIAKKVDKVVGKGLSTEDYTTEEKNKLADLENYDDTEVKESITALTEKHNTEVAELNQKIADLQEEVDMASDLIPTGDESGSDITVKDSARYYFKKFEVSGKSEQETFTGKNLLQLKDNYSIERGGITITTDKDIITINGTASANINTVFPIFNNHQYVEVGKTYTETIKYISGTASNALFYLRTSESTSGSEYQFNNSIGNLKTTDIFETITVVDTGVKKRNGYINFAQLICNAGETFNNYKFKIQLEEGSTATDYEPYTGGQPAPNPNYECPIQNVTGDVEVKVENKNLIVATNYSNSTINNDGTTTTGSNRLSTDYLEINSKESNIVFSLNIKALFLGVAFYDRDKTFISRNTTNNASQIVQTIPDNAKYAKPFVQIGSGITLNGDSFEEYEMQLEYDTATSYAPHEEQTVIFPLAEGQVLHEGDTIEDKIAQNRWTDIVDENSGIIYVANGNYYQIQLTQVSVTWGQDPVSNYFSNKNTDDNFYLFNTKYNKTVNLYDKKDFFERNVENLKNWLQEKKNAGNPMVLEYNLAEPLETEFTQAQATAKAQIDKLYSYKGTTHITSNANLDVTYRKDPSISEETQNNKLEELEARIVLLEG